MRSNAGAFGGAGCDERVGVREECDGGHLYNGINKQEFDPRRENLDLAIS